MSTSVSIDDLSQDQKDNILEILEISSESTYGKAKSFEIYQIEGRTIHLPFSYATNLLGEKPNRDIEYEKIKLEHRGGLREEQKKVKAEALQSLNERGTCFIKARCGFGKTFWSIYMTHKIGLKTCVFTHRTLITDMWLEEFKRFTNANIKVAKSKEIYDENVDIYIVSIMIAHKLGREFLHHFGLVICDEAHSLCAAKSSQVLLYTKPKYLIGLSATPDETDMTSTIINHYFSHHRIKRSLFVKHLVYRMNTNFVPEFEKDYRGKLVWGSVLKSQCESEERNNIILKLCAYFSDRTILVLCKRKVQATYLLEKLKEDNESVDILIANQRSFEYTARILVSTYSKTGVGFNHPRLDMLIIASDVESYIQQYHGRIFRREDSSPIVVDLVDNFAVLKSHWLTRRKYYISTGGEIEIFRKTFRDFYEWEKPKSKVLKEEPELVFEDSDESSEERELILEDLEDES